MPSSDHEGHVRTPDPFAPDGGDSPDPPGWGARFLGSLDIQLGKLTESQDATTAELRKMRRDARRMPANVKRTGVLVYNSGGSIVQPGGTGVGVLIDGPNVGEQWSVRQILVGGALISSTPAGSAWFFVSAAPPTDLTLLEAVDCFGVSADFQALPESKFYGPDQFYVAPNENLYMVIVGGTGGVTYCCSVTVQSSPLVPTEAIVGT